MTAFYDFVHQPASWDFWVWACKAKARNIERVAFDRRVPFKYRNETQVSQYHLFENVVIPICEVFGFAVEYREKEKRDSVFTHCYRGKGNEALAPFRFDLQPDGPPTVTIRQSIKHPERDSNADAWRKFADDIGARVIEDAWVEPLSVADRLEIYRRAPMNYGVANGPLAACIFSNLPVTMFATKASDYLWQCPIGHRMPWLSDSQRIIWEDDTAENIAGVRDE